MNQDRSASTIAAVQIAFLALLFGISLLGNTMGRSLFEQPLGSLLAFEFGILLFGWFLAGLFLVPVVVVDSTWLRRVCLLLAVLIAIPLSRAYLDDFGPAGLLGFLCLLYVNYAGVFLFRMKFAERGRLAGEIGFRAISYIVFFALLAAALGMPSSVERWGGPPMLWFGLIYFSVLTVVEYRRYFPRGVNIVYHLVAGSYHRNPRAGIRYTNGRLRAWVLKGSHTHQWPVLFLAGLASTALSGIFLFSAARLDSWPLIAVVWLFMLPFFIVGLAFLFTAPVYLYRILKNGPVLLEIDSANLENYRQLLATGTVPRYSKREDRQGMEARLICYSVIPVEQDIIRVEEALVVDIDQNLHFQIQNTKTLFQLECRLRDLDRVRSEMKPGERLVCQLQLTVREKVIFGRKVVQIYDWLAAFPLPTH